MNKKLLIMLGISILILIGAVVYRDYRDQSLVDNDFTNDEIDITEEVVSEPETANIYYVKVINETEEIVPIRKEIDLVNGIEKSTITTLLEGVSEDADYTTSIPEGTNLLSFELEQGVATVNFSSELQENVAGSAWVTSIREQIEKTLEQFETVDEVVIMIEGESEGILQP